MGHGVCLPCVATCCRAAPTGDPAQSRSNESGFTVESDGEGGFVVRGTRPERWIAQTDFTNDEAVGYLGDRLARLGVEDELLKLGAKPGCAVTIGDMTFDWEPQTPAGVDVTLSGRGTDARLEQQRPGGRRRAQGCQTRQRRRAQRHDERAPRGDPDRAQRRRQGRHHRADHAVRCVRRRAGWRPWPTRSRAA